MCVFLIAEIIQLVIPFKFVHEDQIFKSPAVKKGYQATAYKTCGTSYNYHFIYKDFICKLNQEKFIKALNYKK